MAQRAQIFKCDTCGNIVEVVHGGPGALVCCGKTMQTVVQNTTDASKEKHVPVVEMLGDGIKVIVGSTIHPMEDKHFIEWIELNTDNGTYRQYLRPGQPPEAFFPVKARTVSVKEYCTLHGLWKA